jgi:hypothetical protein
MVVLHEAHPQFTAWMPLKRPPDSTVTADPASVTIWVLRYRLRQRQHQQPLPAWLRQRQKSAFKASHYASSHSYSMVRRHHNIYLTPSPTPLMRNFYRPLLFTPQL